MAVVYLLSLFMYSYRTAGMSVHASSLPRQDIPRYETQQPACDCVCQASRLLPCTVRPFSGGTNAAFTYRVTSRTRTSQPRT